jgi:hypothetical protein
MKIGICAQNVLYQCTTRTGHTTVEKNSHYIEISLLLLSAKLSLFLLKNQEKFMLIRIPVSVGELFDKISILEIKLANIKDAEKKKSILKEYNYLVKIALKIDLSCFHSTWYDDLVNINKKLWVIEEKKRLCEKKQDFGKEFIRLARNVYLYNDKRAAIKMRINKLFNSTIVEQKSHIN